MAHHVPTAPVADERRQQDVEWRAKLREEDVLWRQQSQRREAKWREQIRGEDIEWRQQTRHEDLAARQEARHADHEWQRHQARLANRRYALLAAAQSAAPETTPEEVFALASRYESWIEADTT